MRIGDRLIADDQPCYVIAEVGHNHQGSLEQALELLAAAKYAGADAVKLQKRDNRSLYTRELFDKPYENENSFGATYGEHREALEFGRPEYVALRERAAELGLHFFATAFDRASVDFLEDLDLPAYKIASGDIRNLPLMRYIAQTGKPVIMSTGGARIEDVEAAHATLSESGDVAVLQCTAGYPASFDQLDLRVIPAFRQQFPDTVIGYSGHDNGIAMGLVAYVLGARIIEKHFTLDRALRGTDHRFSLEPQGMRKLVRDLRRAEVAMGDGVKRVHPNELAPIEKMSKKLVAAADLPAGHVLTEQDIALKSPGDGLDPSHLEQFVGARLTAPVVADQALSFELVGTDGYVPDAQDVAVTRAFN
jgi:N-acetylneuraminate synthase/sialic acid synthase